MTEDEFTEAARKAAEQYIELYSKHCEHLPKAFVIMAMTGALAACATEAGAVRDNLINALNSAFDDIEEG